MTVGDFIWSINNLVLGHRTNTTNSTTTAISACKRVSAGTVGNAARMQRCAKRWRYDGEVTAQLRHGALIVVVMHEEGDEEWGWGMNPLP